MGCGQSNAESEKNNGGTTQETAQQPDPGSRGSKAGSGPTKGGPESVASPANASLSPQNGSMATSAQLGSSSSFASAPGVMMPTHTITDSTGHKVTSCIGSRNKLEVVTRWLDSVVKNRDQLPESRWRNPQEEVGREKQPQTTASQASGGGGSERGVNQSPGGQVVESGAHNGSASQLSLPPKEGGHTIPNQSSASNVPYSNSPQNADLLPAGSPLESTHPPLASIPMDVDNSPKRSTAIVSNNPGNEGSPPSPGSPVAIAAAKYEIEPGTEQKEVTTTQAEPATVTSNGEAPGEATGTAPPATPPSNAQIESG